MLALICVAPDGEYQVEYENFDYDNIEEARTHSANMGSRWYFYPIHVIADADTGVIVEAPDYFDFLVSTNVNEMSRGDMPVMLAAACDMVYGG